MLQQLINKGIIDYLFHIQKNERAVCLLKIMRGNLKRKVHKLVAKVIAYRGSKGRRRSSIILLKVSHLKRMKFLPRQALTLIICIQLLSLKRHSQQLIINHIKDQLHLL